MLERLTKKAEEPDAPAVGKSVSVHVDLSDAKQVALAVKHGFLGSDDLDDDDDDDDDTDKKDDDDDTPKRKGYFGT